MIPRWLGRILWALRGKRRVRLHLERHIPGVSDSMTLEGVLIGRWSGLYVLELARVMSATDASVSLDARYVEVPAERVLFCEVFAP